MSWLASWIWKQQKCRWARNIQKTFCFASLSNFPSRPFSEKSHVKRCVIEVFWQSNLAFCKKSKDLMHIREISVCFHSLKTKVAYREIAIFEKKFYNPLSSEFRQGKYRVLHLLEKTSEHIKLLLPQDPDTGGAAGILLEVSWCPAMLNIYQEVGNV